ncbi:MAG: MBL fold metallo-hydrolase [Lentisphaeria bacterium]|nr:MBL fold metallo-hydrolase [Lentisphaeria bacterium]
MSGKFGITVLGSGSRGNAAVIHGPEGLLLLDAGFSARELENRMENIGIDPALIQGVLITHGHSDHIKGCRTFADRHHIQAYLTAPTLKEGARTHFVPEKKSVIAPGSPFELCGVAVEPFTVPHDAVDTIGCTFRACGRKIGVATDLGHLNLLARQKLRGCSLLMLEANHEPSLLLASARPVQLKRRILGRHGHLSNSDAMAALEELLTEESAALVLAHLSSECNCRELVAGLAEKTLKKLGRTDILLKIASQDSPLETFWLAE